MTNPTDFIVYDMPVMLSRRVTRLDPVDPSKSVRDESWYESVRQKMSTLFSFFEKKGLLRDSGSLAAVQDVVLRFSDFSDRGQRFIMSQAPDKWLASFDRPGSKKKPTDVSYLEKQLAKLGD
jgi:hypothetical protein